MRGWMRRGEPPLPYRHPPTERRGDRPRWYDRYHLLRRGGTRMNPEFWKARWKANRIGFHQPEINRHLKRFWSRLGLRGEGRVFVPLCGKSRDLCWLAEEGHEVLGVELVEDAVRAFHEENGLSCTPCQEERFSRWCSDRIEILCGDFFDLTPVHLEGVRAVYDRAALIALPADMRKRYVGHLLRILPRDAKILLLTLEDGPARLPGPPFGVPEGEVETAFGERFTIERLLEGPIHLQGKSEPEAAVTEKVYLLEPK
ncbi:MAG: thiopurine S-methyltransferase [Deltaproteobacteria bacterium]|nr:MAG: thiopurine S-methyltransferase [Deltaproteobacteria bacterium]